MYSSLFNHRKSINNNDYLSEKNKFCAYMYSVSHDHRVKIFNLINKYKNNNWLIISDNIISDELSNNIPNIIYPQWSEDEKIKCLEQFFACTYAPIIIQSVNFQTCHQSEWSGWSSYSYIAFQIGLSNFNDPVPKLISCNNDEENTRFTYAKKIAERNLINVFMYNEIYK